MKLLINDALGYTFDRVGNIAGVRRRKEHSTIAVPGGFYKTQQEAAAAWKLWIDRQLAAQAQVIRAAEESYQCLLQVRAEGVRKHRSEFK